MRGLICALLMAAGPAVAETWTCNFVENVQPPSGFIAQTVTFAITRPYNDVRVSDDVIGANFGDWKSGTLQTSNEKRVTVTWTVANLKHKNTAFASLLFTGSYSITVMKADGKARIIMGGMPKKTAQGAGRCEMTAQ